MYVSNTPIVLSMDFFPLLQGLFSASGTLLSLSSLKKYVSPCWEEPIIGASIWASSRKGKRAGIWREDELNQGLVVFHDNGIPETLAIEEMVLPQYAEIIDCEERKGDYSSSKNSRSRDYENNGRCRPQGLGFVENTALQKGIQTDTTIFADWESHTRGIASKMMARMGYRKGMGLGIRGQGMVEPIPVKVLPPKQSLDHALQSIKNEERGESSEKQKKRSRDGKCKRKRKIAEAVSSAKQEQQQRPGVCSFLNTQVSGHAQMISNDSSGKKKKGKKTKKEDRRSLFAYEKEVKELRVRVEKFEDMVKKEKAVYEAAVKKLADSKCKIRGQS